MAFMCAVLLSVLAQANTVAVDNGAIRVEFDLDLFVVRYIGVPGGENLVAPLFVPEAIRSGKGLANGGGLRAELHPILGRDPAIVRGPAKVIEQSKYHVVLLGALSESTGVQVKKEIRLDRTAAKALYTVTALSSSSESRPVLIYSAVNLPQGIELIPEADAEDVKVLDSSAQLPDLAKIDGKQVRIPIPPLDSKRSATLITFAPAVTHVGERTAWTRRLAVPGTPDDYAGGNNFMCRLDAGKQLYEAVLLGPLETLAAATPVVFREEWTIEERKPPAKSEEDPAEPEGAEAP